MVLASAVGPAWAYLPGAGDVINPSMGAWFTAAKTGRSDMLIVGDSMVMHDSDGWDSGMILALKSHTGLAASGLLQDGGEGEQYAVFGTTTALDLSQQAVRPDRQGFVWRQRAETAGATPIGDFAASSFGNTLGLNGGYDWQLYMVPTANAPQGQGKFDSFSRLGVPDYKHFTSNTSYTISTPASGLVQKTLHYDRPAQYNGQPMEVHLTNMQNLSVLYSRISIPGATGASVTSWGYGGHSTLGFYKDYWMGQGMTAAGRRAWFDAMTLGGSGKLNIVLEEGLNDRNETQPSLAGTTPGNSAKAFKENIQGLMSQIRTEWGAAGRNANDLTFMLLGTYEDSSESVMDQGSSSGMLHAYSNVLQEIALADPQVSFIDLLNHAPRYDDANARGYMFDGVHAAKAGTTLYSEMIIDTLQAYGGVDTTGGVKWTVNAPGNWSTASYWSGAVPNGAGAMARFSEAALDQRTITLDVPVTVGTLQLDNPNGYVIAGPSTLGLATTSGSARINVMSGAHEISTAVRLNSSTIVTVPIGSKLTISGDMSSAPFASLTKAGRGELAVKHVRAASLNITGGTVRVVANGADSGVSYFGGLTIDRAAGGALDLMDNDLVLGYSGASPFTTIRDLVLAGYSAIPDSTKTGIISSTGQAERGERILAVFDNAIVKMAEWPPGSGRTIGQNSIVGCFTFLGDTNLDGAVTPQDYTAVDSNLGLMSAGGFGWFLGDANADGRVTAQDYSVIDASLGMGQGGNGSRSSAVPEGGVGFGVVLGGIWFLRRRVR
jgi:lysophospholipase L1-like esterase